MYILLNCTVVRTQHFVFVFIYPISLTSLHASLEFWKTLLQMTTIFMHIHSTLATSPFVHAQCVMNPAYSMVCFAT